MAKQQQQNPRQPSSTLAASDRVRADGDDARGTARAERDPKQPKMQDRPQQARSQDRAQRSHSPGDAGMDTTHRAGHVSYSDSRFGQHASTGRDEHAEHAPDTPDRPPRGGAQTGLTGSTDPLRRAEQQRQPDQPARSKYSPTGNEQDRLSQLQGGESLRDPSQRSGTDADRERDPRAGPAGDDSPLASPAAPRGKQTATHDIDLAGPDSSATRRDR